MTQYACCDKHGLSRRDLLKGVAAGAVTAASPLAATAAKEGKKMTTTETMGQAPVVACKKVAANAPGAKAKVYFSRKIDAQTLIDLYERINEGIYGKVAIKLHTGEKNGPNILPRDMVKAFQATVPDSVIVETNTLYEGDRFTTEQHLETLKVNGWTFCPVDIMDAGHAMGGFGGSMKNIAIGCADGRIGKAQVHAIDDVNKPWDQWPAKERLMETMAESAKAVIDHFGKHIVYINVMRRMSVDCDCAGTAAAEPTIEDVGILASTDILAIDQACVDLVYATPHNHDLVERIESRVGMHQLTPMRELKLGSDRYTIIEV